MIRSCKFAFILLCSVISTLVSPISIGFLHTDFMSSQVQEDGHWEFLCFLTFCQHPKINSLQWFVADFTDMYTPSVVMPTYRLSDTPASILKTDPETPTVEDSRQATQDWCFLLRWKQLGLAQRVKDRSRPLSDANMWHCQMVSVFSTRLRGPRGV